MSRMIRRHGPFALALLVLAGGALWLFGLGGSGDVARWAATEQREVQQAMAGTLRAVRAGQGWAWAGLLGLCFSYGFFHAAGPGHGKLVMGGYALSEPVPRRRIVWMTLAAALGQALCAIALVYAGVWIWGLGRAQLTGLAEGGFALFGALAICAVGLWLLWRGVRRWRAAARGPGAHVHDEACGHGASCGHAHGPSAEQIAGATDWRSALGVVVAIAARPCTGALFVLILTYSMGIALAGIAGALAMALGTAVLTLAVALGAGALRGGLAGRLQGSAGLRAMGLVEIAAGALVALVAGQVALRLVNLPPI